MAQRRRINTSCAGSCSYATASAQSEDKSTEVKAEESQQALSTHEDSVRGGRAEEELLSDHPWELARPRVVLENDGKDFEKNDWSSISQPGRALNGER